MLTEERLINFGCMQHWSCHRFFLWSFPWIFSVSLRPAWDTRQLRWTEFDWHLCTDTHYYVTYKLVCICLCIVYSCVEVTVCIDFSFRVLAICFYWGNPRSFSWSSPSLTSIQFRGTMSDKASSEISEICKVSFNYNEFGYILFLTVKCEIFGSDVRLVELVRRGTCRQEWFCVRFQDSHFGVMLVQGSAKLFAVGSKLWPSTVTWKSRSQCDDCFL